MADTDEPSGGQLRLGICPSYSDNYQQIRRLPLSHLLARRLDFSGPRSVSRETEETEMTSPWSAAVAGALISGVVMYTVSERSDRVDAFTQPAPVEYVQTVDGRWIPVAPVAQPA